MITIEKLKEEIESLGYIATEELIYDAYNALCMFEDNKINSGQDIYAICLEGPPGAGKTEFAKTYTKLSKKIFKEPVELVDYQCDATTGKTELFEDINISAAIRGDADNVNIPGKLVEAIKKVNAGSKVILFIDEYDKAREETDAFLLQFLQSGKINSTQHGDLEIKDEYKSNLQVILCKNDMREELSGPLSRRIRILRLDYMEPETFLKVAKKVLVENRENSVNSGLLNLVILMYQQAYMSKEMFNRLPSCSEMLIALEDADRLMTKANAPQHIIYNTIIRNMFKSADDIKSFESILENSSYEEGKKLNKLIKEMKSNNITTQSINPVTGTKVSNNQQDAKKIDLNELIAAEIFSGKASEFEKKTKEMQDLINEYQKKFENIEQQRKKVIDEEIQKILLENGKLVSSYDTSNVVKNFDDESAFVKRGENIFELTKEDWVEVGMMISPNLSHSFLIDKMINFASQMDIKIYENGILLKGEKGLNLIVFKDFDQYNKARYRFMASHPVLPSTYLKDIENFLSLVEQTVLQQQKVPEPSKIYPIAHYAINALVYNDTPLDYESTEENVYNIECSSRITKEKSINDFSEIVAKLQCSDINNALTISEKIMSGKRKALTNE